MSSHTVLKHIWHVYHVVAIKFVKEIKIETNKKEERTKEHKVRPKIWKKGFKHETTTDNTSTLTRGEANSLLLRHRDAPPHSLLPPSPLSLSLFNLSSFSLSVSPETQGKERNPKIRCFYFHNKYSNWLKNSPFFS